MTNQYQEFEDLLRDQLSTNWMLNQLRPIIDTGLPGPAVRKLINTAKTSNQWRISLSVIYDTCSIWAHNRETHPDHEDSITRDCHQIGIKDTKINQICSMDRRLVVNELRDIAKRLSAANIGICYARLLRDLQWLRYDKYRNANGRTKKDSVIYHWKSDYTKLGAPWTATSI